MHRLHSLKFLLLVFGICGCSPKRPAAQIPGTPQAASPNTVAHELPNPLPISPVNGAALKGYPRTVTFQWSDVPGAARYGIEIDCYGCCAPHSWCTDVGRSNFTVQTLARPTYTFNFWGDQPGRWRVWAIGPNLTAFAKSQWSEFTFGQVVGGNIIPPVIAPSASSELIACDPARRPVSAVDVTVPKAIYSPSPEYSETARKDKLNGMVELGLEIGDDGKVRTVCVARSLRSDLDAQAMGAVKTWRFEPARRNGTAISWYATVQVVFALK